MRVPVTEITRYEYRCDCCGEDVTNVGHKAVRVKTTEGLYDDSDTKFYLDHVCQKCRHILYLRFGQAIKELREGSK